jgi:dolichol-phosphate mannosyltransferase
METKELSIVIPAYLEEKNLRVILPKLNAVLKKLVPSYEVLIVDTMKSMDDTVLVCKENGDTYINRMGGNNYGDAVRTGIQNAQGVYTIFMDADGSHDPEFIKNLYDNKEGNDVVIASRYTEGGKTDNGKALVFMSLIINLTYSIVLNLKCKDVSNSFKLYRTSDIKKLQLKCNNFDIVEEILFKLKKSKGNIKIKEIPFAFQKRMFGDTKRNLFVFAISYIVTIIKLRFGK